MTAVRIDTASGVSISPPEELFSLGGQMSGTSVDLAYLSSGTGYDVSADGQRLFMISRSQGDGIRPPRMILVQNWRRMLDGR